MIDQNAEPPIAEPASSDISSPDRPSANCPEIVPSSIEERADASAHAGLNDEEELWIATVLNRPQTRSAEVREALAKALLDGHEGVGPLLAPFLVKVGYRALRPGYRREPMRQRVLLSLDRDLPGTNANFLTNARTICWRSGWSPLTRRSRTISPSLRTVVKVILPGPRSTC